MESSKKMRRFLWEMIKCIVFILCVVGFVYQITEFIIYFYTYPTIVDIEIQEPDYVLRPAVTICNTNPVKRSVFCSKYESECRHVKDPEKFCIDHPLYCGANLNMSDFYVPKKPSLHFHDMDYDRRKVDFLNAIPEGFLKIDDSGKKERLEGPFYISCLVQHCYSMNNLAITSEPTKKTEIERHLKIFPSQETAPQKIVDVRAIVAEAFEVRLDETDHYDYFSTPRALLSIHSPFTLVDPNFDGVALVPNREYKIHVKLEEDHKLKLPYKTDCRDYEEEWIKNNRNGPTSQEVCIYDCLNALWENCYNRPHPWTFFTIEEACSFQEPGTPNIMCNSEEERRKLMVNCTSSCKVACKERRYTIRVQDRPFIDWQSENSSGN
ncbi:uncharacterized protein [Parasteatoda tepidariorum]|uniref:uncharacterized protein isoform X2 n=1 Tax=Parasteatoda tepidariorum TaxID=114398 RepID=UPI0039BD121C